MEKNSTLLVLLSCSIFAICGCGDDPDADDTDECVHGDQMCLQDVLQICENGAWVDWTDCSAVGQECVVINGEAQCIGSDTDADADTDTD